MFGAERLLADRQRALEKRPRADKIALLLKQVRVEQHLLDGEIVASCIAWETEKITRTADEILAANSQSGDAPERSEAEAFLRDMLATGPRPATEMEEEAKGASISLRTLRRARRKLGIKPYRQAETGEGLGSDGRWYWGLPADGSKVANSSYDGHGSDAGRSSGHVSGASKMATNFSSMAILVSRVAILEGGHLGRRWPCYNNLATLGDRGHLSGAEQ
jgi:hypothetical protein